MPSILVVEHEGRYIERIQDALSSEGWSPRFVAGRPEALRAAASQQPDLVLVNTELPGAPELMRAFARHRGGPGAVALLAEHQPTVEPAEVGADAVLSKPFTDQELRLVVRRGLNRQREPLPEPAAAAPAAEGADEGPKLTSADIFGDLLAEVEDEPARPAAGSPGAAEPGAANAGATEQPVPAAGSTAAPAPAPAAAPATPAAPGTASPGTASPGTASPGTASPAAASGAPASASPAPRPPASATSRSGGDDPEIARRLERTLSGLLPDAPRRPRTAGGPGAAEAPRRRRPRSDADVDELLNLTLSSLDEPAKSPRRPAATAGERPATDRSPRRERLFEDLDLSEIEALASPRRAARASDEAAPEPGTAPEEPTAAAAPAADPGAPGATSVAADDGEDDSWADVAREVERSTEVPPPHDFQPRGFGSPPSEPRRDADEEGVQRFGHYKLMERIAVGGMAEVWQARMSGVEGFQKTVAIKKILPQMTDNADFVSMFIDEAKLAAQLNHPNITHIYDLGKIGRDFYIAMEYVEGPNLRNTLIDARRKGVPLPAGLALLVGARLASALDYAHRKRDFDDRELQLVHRDVSPQNVLLSYEGDIKLCDFGIVKAVTKASHTQMGALKGKLPYMSPEQAWGQTVDARSDIFSLGSLLFEMLTGERLFSGDNEISVLESVRECRVRSPRELNPGVPEAAERVVRKALAKDPDARYQSAGALQQDLEEILYQLKPAPSQGDLAAWLRRLDDVPELDEEARAVFTWNAGATGAAAGAAGATDSSSRGEARPSTATGTGGEAGSGVEAAPGGRSAAATASPAVAGVRADEASGTGTGTATGSRAGRDADPGTGTGTGPGAAAGRSAPPASPGASASPAAARGGAHGGDAPAGDAQGGRRNGDGTGSGSPSSVLPESSSGRGDATLDLGATRPVPVFRDAPEPPNRAADGAATGSPAAEDRPATDEPGTGSGIRQAGGSAAAGGTGGAGSPGTAGGTAPGLSPFETDESSPAEAVAPAPGVDGVEAEEGGRRGLWLVVALIVLVLAAGLAWYFLARPPALPTGEPLPGDAPIAAPEEPTGEGTEVPPEGAGDEAGAASGGESGPTGGEAAAAVPRGAVDPAVVAESPAGTDGSAAATAEDGTLPPELEQFVEAEMAKREELLQEKERERQRQLRALEAELARVQAQAEADRRAAEAAEAAGSDEGPPAGGGDGR